MEQLFIYLLKSSGLIALFYLAYHFLVRKETFFNNNRWFLLSGLSTSLILPLFFIKKIILVEKPKISAEDLVAFSQATTPTIQDVSVVEAFDWMQFIWISYVIIACVLVLKIVFNFASLYRMLYQQQVIKKEQFKLVNLNENIAPFSFFNYIVYNSDLYSNEELQSILLHEKIHSKEKHSVDVLIAKLFCIVFWFNPFIWLYKKAITQNLEYIADQKAINQLEDKKSYQHALLKVVSHQSCLSITNNFYQSLIKKRIVMLNKNQSHKRNLFKYALIIPALIGFVLLFQVKVIAQEKEETNKTKYTETHEGADITFDSKETDKSLKTLKNVFKEEKIVTEVSKIKRNSAGEIIGICIKMKCEDGRKKELKINQNTPIDKIFIYTKRLENGVYDFGVKHVTGDEISYIRNMVKRKRNGFYTANNNEAAYAVNVDDSLDVIGNFDFNFDMEAPEAPEPAEVPEATMFPKHFWNDSNTQTKIIVKKDGKNPLVIMNGRVIEGDEGVLSKKELDELIVSSSKGTNDDGNQIIINGKEVLKIKSNAMANVDIQMKRIRPQMEKQMELIKAQKGKVKAEMERVRAEMSRSRSEMDASKPEMESAKEEMARAKEEMLKAKVEMEAAKAEYEKAKAELKK